MDEKAKEILARIETELAALREKLSALEEELASCRAAAAAPSPEPVAGPVDLSDVVALPDLPEDASVETPPGAPVEAPEDLPEEEPAADAAVTQVEETQVEVTPVVEAPVEAPSAPKTGLRQLSGEYRWQKDRPGAPVRNIRSGISLYDRALFINTLFQEDFSRYDETIAALNACGGLDEAVDYLIGAFPDWNWSGDAVYAFMMSIRKKLG